MERSTGPEMCFQFLLATDFKRQTSGVSKRVHLTRFRVEFVVSTSMAFGNMMTGSTASCVSFLKPLPLSKKMIFQHVAGTSQLSLLHINEQMLPVI